MSRSVVMLLLLLACPAGAQQLRPVYSELGPLGDGGVFQMLEIPGGRYVLYNFEMRGQSRGELRVFDRQLSRWRIIGSGESDLALSPRGDQLAFMRADEKDALHIWTQRINPRTARLEGVARRVSLRGGRGPAFSPDGRWIAYTVLPSGQDTSRARLVVVPSAGGPERVLVRGIGFAQQLRWSPDGQWIYYRYREGNGPNGMEVRRTVSRVRARGGAPEVVKRVDDFIGLSADGRFMAYYPEDAFNTDRVVLAIATAEGVEVGRIVLPRMLAPKQWAAEGLKLLAARHDLPTGVRVAPFTGGAARALSPATGVYDGAPAWSADGRWLAMATLFGEDRQLVVVGAVGGARRHVPTRAEPDATAPLWSPDGRYLAFTSGRGRSLHAVEVATGAEARLAAGEGLQTARMAWRRDGRAVLYMWREGGRREIRESTLGGITTTTRALTGELADNAFVRFVGDSALVIAARSGIYTAPARGSGARRIYAAGEGEQPQWAGWGVEASRDGRYAAVPVVARVNGAARDVIHVVPLGAGAQRAVPLSYIAYSDAFRWHPDGQHLVVTGTRDNRSPERIQLVPLNGEPIRALTDQSTVRDGDPAISPDGRLLAYTSALAVRSVFYEMDLTRALAGLVRTVAPR